MLLDSFISLTKDRRAFTWLESVGVPNYKAVELAGRSPEKPLPPSFFQS